MNTIERLQEMLAEKRYLGMERIATVAWENGMAAGKAGKLFIDNPYPQKYIEHEAWENGRLHEVARTIF